MDRLIRQLQRWVRGSPRAILIGFALVAFASALAATRVRIDSRINGLMIADDPELARTLWMKSTFSNDEALILAFELGHPFTADDLRRLAQVSERVSQLADVQEVIDLSNVEDVRGDGETLDGSPLVDFATLGQDVAALQARVRSHRLYRRLLVSDDLDVLAMIILQPPPDPAHPEATKAMVAAVHDLLAAERLPWKVHRVGPPESEALADDLVRKDLATLGLPAFALALWIVYLACGSVFAVGLTVLLVAWSELVMLGWLGASGTPLTMVTALAPVILLAPASIYAVYLLALLQGIPDDARTLDTLIEQYAPSALLSVASTVAGFLALPSINVRGVSELGTTLTVGILAAGIGSLLLLPVLIARRGLRLREVRMRWIERLGIQGVALARHPWATLAATAAILAVAVAGIWRIEIETDPLDYFRPDHEHIRSEHFVREHLSGTRILDVVLETGERDGALEPGVQRFAHDLIREIESSPIVERTHSLLDYVYLMDAALEPEHTPREVLPSRALLSQYLLLYESGGDPGDLRHFLDGERADLNLIVRMSTVSTKQILGLRRKILAFAASRPDAPRVEVLGHAYLFAKASDGIVRGMVKGLLLASGMIIAVTALALRSVRLALLAAVPTIAPIFLCAGVLGWLGVPLSLGTSLVGCLALGLSVDDTAHVIGHVDREHGIAHTYAIVARPIILETLSLGLGFAVLGFSQFQTVAMLGIATSLTLFVALAFDLFVLPSLLAIAGYPLGEAAAAGPHAEVLA